MLKGEATGPEVEEEATTVITTRGALAHSSPGGIPCSLVAHHPGASTTRGEGVREGAGELWEG